MAALVITPIILPLKTSGTSIEALPCSVRFSGLGYRSRFRGFRVKCSQQVAAPTPNAEAKKLRQEFIEILKSRRTPVDLKWETKKKLLTPNDPPPSFCEMNCDKIPTPRCASFSHPFSQSLLPTYSVASTENLKDQLVEEHLYLHTEASDQGKLPVLIMSTEESSKSKRPVVVFCHSTSTCKDWWRPLLKNYASRGYIAVAIDARHHGERAVGPTYDEALVSAWKDGKSMPFIYDTVWDLIKLADYLEQRDDIDSKRIGITGVSLGGMHTWFAAFADDRYQVAVPMIGVQGFRWAVDNDKYHARVDSIKAVFDAARVELRKPEIDKEVVETVWEKIAPGLASHLDSPYSIPAIAPRPLLIMNGKLDRRCPIEGLDLPLSKAEKAYEEANCKDKFKFISVDGLEHSINADMIEEASKWFDKYL